MSRHIWIVLVTLCLGRTLTCGASRRRLLTDSAVGVVTLAKRASQHSGDLLQVAGHSSSKFKCDEVITA
jgi:hypothetical protein